MLPPLDSTTPATARALRYELIAPATLPAIAPTPNPPIAPATFLGTNVTSSRSIDGASCASCSNTSPHAGGHRESPNGSAKLMGSEPAYPYRFSPPASPIGSCCVRRLDSLRWWPGLTSLGSSPSGSLELRGGRSTPSTLLPAAFLRVDVTCAARVYRRTVCPTANVTENSERH
jgi:hypothetical protein